jgi:hypothetical protein
LDIELQHVLGRIQRMGMRTRPFISFSARVDVLCTRPMTHSTESVSTTILLVTQFSIMVKLKLK